LHRAFSIFIFHTDTKQVLIQQRALSKQTWPGVWSNSCCGHPKLNESTEDAIRRRSYFELGISHFDTLMFASPYRYRYERDGIVENEICPIYIGTTSEDASPNPAEVETYQWVTWKEFMHMLTDTSTDFSEWCREETYILQKTEVFQNLTS
ncbi:MAG: isopentenyl-diphosphate Delta-isomerase, partial [Candidatus Paceibacteria bacterium]